MLDREVARLTPAAFLAFEQVRSPNNKGMLSGLFADYQGSQAFKRLAERTQRDRRKFLSKASAEIGHWDLKAVAKPGAKLKFIEWRNRYQDTPKTADELLNAVGYALKWGVEEGKVAASPLRDVGRLYHSNRADVIWEERHLAAIKPHAADELWWAIQLDIHTGARLSDLIALKWENVSEDAMSWQTGKSRGRRTVVVPMTDELKALLATIPGHGDTILTSARKKRWTASGMESALRRAKLDALDAARRVGGLKAESGVEGHRFHDLRGTAATVFLRAGLTIEDIALILGWSKDEVQRIAIRYVTTAEMGRAMVDRLKRAKASTPPPALESGHRTQKEL